MILEDNTELTVNRPIPNSLQPRFGKVVQAMPRAESITYSALCTILAKKYGGRLATEKGQRKDVGGCYRRGYILVDGHDLTSPKHKIKA